MESNQLCNELDTGLQIDCNIEFYSKPIHNLDQEFLIHFRVDFAQRSRSKSENQLCFM